MESPPTARLNAAAAARLAGVDLLDARVPFVRAEQVEDIVVVLPRSRDAQREIHLERCRADGVPVVRRPSGGGAVVLAPGVVVASLLAPLDPAARFPDHYFRRFGAAVARALIACGAPAPVERGVSDLCLGDRKIAGSSLRVRRDSVLYQVSVLADLDLALLDRYLPMPSREPAYRAARPHAAFVTTLAREGVEVSAAELASVLQRTLEDELGLPRRRPNV